MILYRETKRPFEKKTPVRYSRHYYDFYQLSFSSFYAQALANRDLLHSVVCSNETFYPETWMTYAEAEKNLALVPPQERKEALKQDYQSMAAMFFGDQPDLEIIFQRLREIEKDFQTGKE
jgi:hypothetical protein